MLDYIPVASYSRPFLILILKKTCIEILVLNDDSKQKHYICLKKLKAKMKMKTIYV